MAKIRLLPPCKVELIPVIFGVIISNARKDLTPLHAESTDITEEFLDGLDLKNEQIKVMVRPHVLTSELKNKLDEVHGIMRTTRPKLNSLQIKLGKNSKSFTVASSKFGIHEVRNAISKEKVPAYLLAMGSLLSNIDKNTEELLKKGFTSAKRKELEDIKKVVDTEFEANKELFEEYDELSESNVIFINQVWADISEILRVGKLVFYDQTAKLKEYTFIEIKRHFTVIKKKKKDDKTPPSDPPATPPGS